MLRTAKILEKMKVRTRDGAVGNLRDIYFHDDHWKVRYLVVDLGGVRRDEPGRLVSPLDVLTDGSTADELLLDLTADQIQRSPPATIDERGSESLESNLYGFHGWSPYWAASSPLDLGMKSPDVQGEGLSEIVPFPGQATVAGVHIPRFAAQGDPHLRSMQDIAGYRIKALDDDFGRVEDFVIDDRRWGVPFLIVDAKNWWPGQRVLIPSRGISGVSLSETVVFVSLPREVIQRSPEYDPDIALSAEYTSRLDTYYTHQLLDYSVSKL